MERPERLNYCVDRSAWQVEGGRPARYWPDLSQPSSIFGTHTYTGTKIPRLKKRTGMRGGGGIGVLYTATTVVDVDFFVVYFQL